MHSLLVLTATGLLLSACASSPPTVPAVTSHVVANAAQDDEQQALEAAFDEYIDPAEMDAWLQTLAAEPNHVGSPHNKSNAEFTLGLFRDWGWNAHIETFRVLYPTPVEVSLDLLGVEPYSVRLTEPAIASDPPTAAPDALGAYLAYQGDGDVSAPLVFANYGMPEDYEALQRMGVSVEGRIVLTRYGGGWRGLKPKLAQEHGAIGCILYSDPHEDGYGMDDVYPEGPARPAAGIQRGSVMDMTTYPGDPLTPGVGASEDAERLTRGEAVTILKIPAVPISYGEAQKLLAALGGQVAPPSFRGSLALTYHLGDDGEARAHLVVHSDWSLKTLHNVIATLPGSVYPDQWVLRGNHRDGWVMGASDPLSGHIAMMAEAKAIGTLVKDGWRPKRTLVYCSWDGEEPGLIGSTEWAETHEDELRAKALLYINTDGNARGFLGVGGSPALQRFVNAVASDVTDPQTQVSVGDRLRAKLAVDSIAPGASARSKRLGAIATDPIQDLPLSDLGSGSDYSTFFQHLGLSALNVGYGGEGSSGGVYHSLYDDYAHHSRFVDPGAVYSGVLAKTVGRMVLRMSQADLPPQTFGPFADTVARYVDEVKDLADTKRAAAKAQAQRLSTHAFELAADPTHPYGPPTPLEMVPHFNFAPLENAVEHLRSSAEAYDTGLAENGADLSSTIRAHLFDDLRETEQALTVEIGLPGRPWYRNVVWAPGTLTGYGAKTLPGVREAIEQERWPNVNPYVEITAKAIEAYAHRLENATEHITS